MTQQNQDYVSIVRNLYEAFNSRQLEKTSAWIAPDAEWRNLPFGTTFKGPEGYLQAQRNWIEAFPDGKVEIKQLLLAGDWVIAEFVGRGMQQGPLRGPAGELPATGKRVELPFCELFRFRDGKLISGRSYFDLATMLRQIGQVGAKLAA